MRGGHEGALRVVFDTNVLISALGFKGRATATLWELVDDGKIELFASPFILQELLRNLIDKAEFSPGDAKELVEMVAAAAQVVTPKETVSVVTRKDSDNRILECALEARASVLVTGNMEHLRPLGEFQGVEILTPRELLTKHFPP